MKSKIFNIICIIAGLAMAIFGVNKFFHFFNPESEPTAEQMIVFGAFGVIKWLMPLVGAGEFLGGLALANSKTRALGAIMLFPITLGILIHGLTLDSSGLSMGIAFFAINLWTIYENRERYMPMIQ